MTEKIKKFIEEFKKIENRETIKINLIPETKTPPDEQQCCRLVLLA